MPLCHILRLYRRPLSWHNVRNLCGGRARPRRGCRPWRGRCNRNEGQRRGSQGLDRRVRWSLAISQQSRALAQ